MIQLSDIMRQQTADLKTRLPPAVETASQVIYLTLKDVWPSPQWGVAMHPYATGDSLGKWSKRKLSDLRFEIRNDSGHAFYTEEGYTRRGRATARSYARRAVGPYSHTTIESTAAIEQRRIHSLIDGVLRG